MAEVGRLVYSVPELARMLGISRNLAYDLARRGELPVPLIVLGRRLVVSKKAVEALLEAGKLPKESCDA